MPTLNESTFLHTLKPNSAHSFLSKLTKTTNRNPDEQFNYPID